MVANNPNYPIPSPLSEEKRAWSDFKNHIIILIGNKEHGVDTKCALTLLRDLEQAVKDSI